MPRDQSLNAYWAFQVPKASLVLHDVAGMVSWGQNLLSDPIAHMFIGWVINMIKLLQPYRLQHRGITGNLDSESAFGWVFQFICMAKGSAKATDFVLCELPILWEADSIDYSAFINFQLYSSEAPWDLCLAIISVRILWPWGDFSSLWCQPPFSCPWYSRTCFWFLTSLSSFVWQALNHCFKIAYSWNFVKQHQTILSFLLAFADLQFYFKRGSRGLSSIDNYFSWSQMYENLSFVMKTLLECRYFSPLLMQGAFRHDLYLSD